MLRYEVNKGIKNSVKEKYDLEEDGYTLSLKHADVKTSPIL